MVRLTRRTTWRLKGEGTELWNTVSTKVGRSISPAFLP